MMWEALQMGLPREGDRNLTREEILAMEPGRELDILIGKQFGVTPKIEWCAMDKEESGYFIWFEYKDEALDWDERMKTKFPNHPYSTGGKIVRKEVYPHYSTNITHAWEVVDKIGNGDVLQIIAFEHELRDLAEHIFNITPAKICKAALLAVMKP